MSLAYSTFKLLISENAVAFRITPHLTLANSGSYEFQAFAPLKSLWDQEP
jgi:hypothetical protein